ncbi:MAG: chromate efflux transporter [Planctomycetes bacterium]|nr:chromate efflux transporter [Planctomycetota bacterium]
MPTYREALTVWLRVALLSFGGPAAQIAVMHRILVEEKRWVSENRFLHALNYCMLLPGPEATQLAAYIGWLLHGSGGGLTAGLLFILPGYIVIMALSILFALFHQVTVVQALFFGLKAAVMAVVIEAVIRIGRRALKNSWMVTLSGLAFTAIFFFAVPFPLIILSAAVIGFIGGRLRPDKFCVIGAQADSASDSAVIDDATAQRVQPTLGRALRVGGLWLLIWLGPVAVLLAVLGRENVFTREAVFFSKAAVVTFGGAYAVLPYVAQQAVEHFHWLAPGDMLVGLSMAETTPGPLIMVLQFVGFMGAFNQPGALPPLLAGVFGGTITVWVTFAPCFMWIFLGAPYIERLRNRRLLGAAMSAITAVVVGVIMNLAVWFALHVLFTQLTEHDYGPVRLLVPSWGTLDWAALLLAVGALVALVRFKANMIATLGVCALAGLVWSLLMR